MTFDEDDLKIMAYIMFDGKELTQKDKIMLLSSFNIDSKTIAKIIGTNDNVVNATISREKKKQG